MDSISLDDGASDADSGWDFVDGYPGVDHARAISDIPEQHLEQNRRDESDPTSDDDDGGAVVNVPRGKKGGYDSRVEQILYENPQLPILIVDAGKSSESGGKYIVYTIRTGVRVRMRSSEDG